MNLAYVILSDLKLRGVICKILAFRYYNVECFSKLTECPIFSENISSHPDSHHTVTIITELNHPETMDIDNLYDIVKKCCSPRQAVLLACGWSVQSLEYARQLGFKVITKPFHIVELQHWLDAYAVKAINEI